MLVCFRTDNSDTQSFFKFRRCKLYFKSASWRLAYGASYFENVVVVVYRSNSSWYASML